MKTRAHTKETFAPTPLARFWWRACVLPMLAFLLTGCETVQEVSLTYHLWHTDDFRKFSGPAPNPDVALFETTNQTDMLVQYNAWKGRRTTLKRRPFFLQPNRVRLAAGEKLIFVKPSAANGMRPVPILPQRVAVANLPPEQTTYAVATEDNRRFTLHRRAEFGETIDLPVYGENSGLAARLALTPFAVAGDTVLVAAGLAVVCFIGLAESNASFSIH